MAGSFVLCVCARAQRTVYLAVVSSKPLRAVGVALVLQAPALAGKKAKACPQSPGLSVESPGSIRGGWRALQWEAKSRAYAGNCRFWMRGGAHATVTAGTGLVGARGRSRKSGPWHQPQKPLAAV